MKYNEQPTCLLGDSAVLGVELELLVPARHQRQVLLEPLVAVEQVLICEGAGGKGRSKTHEAHVDRLHGVGVGERPDLVELLLPHHVLREGAAHVRVVPVLELTRQLRVDLEIQSERELGRLLAVAVLRGGGEVSQGNMDIPRQKHNKSTTKAQTPQHSLPACRWRSRTGPAARGTWKLC